LNASTTTRHHDQLDNDHPHIDGSVRSAARPSGRRMRATQEARLPAWTVRPGLASARHGQWGHRSSPRLPKVPPLRVRRGHARRRHVLRRRVRTERHRELFPEIKSSRFGPGRFELDSPKIITSGFSHTPGGTGASVLLPRRRRCLSTVCMVTGVRSCTERQKTPDLGRVVCRLGGPRFG
jgi:hypothetical protein